jgi:hypothetical protein
VLPAQAAVSTGEAGPTGEIALKKLARRMTMVLLAAGVASCSTAPAPSRSWQPLFDGRSLDGWSPKIRGFPFGENYRNTFRAEDGVIRVSYEDYDQFGERFGHLFYKTPFKAYRLRLEYRFVGEWLPDTPRWAYTNSGVMFHAQPPETMALDQAFPVSIEAQFLGEHATVGRDTANLCTPGTNIVMNGQLVTEHCNPAKAPVRPDGEWVRFEVEVKPDGTVTHFVNGEPAIIYSGVQLDPEARMADSKPLIAAAGGRLEIDGGYIALQSEGSPIEFRNIEIIELRRG